MNKTYRSIFNETTGSWMAVAETAHARGKKSGRALLCAAGAALTLAGVSGQALAADVVCWTPATIGSSPVGNTSAAGNQIACGEGAVATGANSMAVGINASADSTDPAAGATALGYSAKASGAGALAAGVNALAAGVAATAIGNGANASNPNDVFVGNGAGVGFVPKGIVTGTATNPYNAANYKVLAGQIVRNDGSVPPAAEIANFYISGNSVKYLVDNTTANPLQPATQNNIGIGNNAGKNSTGQGNVATGNSAAQNFYGTNSVSIGTNSNNFSQLTRGFNSVAIGNGTKTGAESAVAIGNGAVVGIDGTTNANADSSIAVGQNAKVSSSNSIAMGSGANNGGAFSVAIGDGSNVANGTRNIALGSGAVTGIDRAGTVSGVGSAVAIGSASRATGNTSIAIGSGATAVQLGVALGNAASALGDTSFAFAGGSYATGYNGMALGPYSRTLAWMGVALGEGSVSVAASSTALGSGTYVSGANSGAFGATKPTDGFHSRDFNNGTAGSSNLSMVLAPNAYAIGNNNLIGSASSGSFAMGNNVLIGADSATVQQTTGTQNGSTTYSYGTTESGRQTVQNAIGIGNGAQVWGSNGIAMGQGALAGNKTNSAGTQSAIAIGQAAIANTAGTVMVGQNAGSGTSSGTNRVAIGANAGTNVTGNTNAAVGSEAGQTVNGVNNSAFGYQAGGSVGTVVAANNNLALGTRSGIGISSGSRNIATGWNAGNTIAGGDNIASGSRAGNSVTGVRNIGTGYYAGSGTTGDKNIASGFLAGANVTGSDNIALGSQAGTLTAGTVGSNGEPVLTATTALAVNNAIAIGNLAVGSKDNTIAIGKGAQATGTQSISIGTGNVVSGNNSGAIGDPNTVSGSNSYAVGNNNTIAQDNTFVVGSGVTTTQANSVVLGNNSADRAAVPVSSGTINGTTYNYAGVASAANGVISVGAAGKERQIINVAAGQVSSGSTDAINGSQLYATNQAIAAAQTHYYSVNDGGMQQANYNNGGAVGRNSLAAGVNASTTNGAENAIAIGNSALGGFANAVAIGTNAHALQDSAIAIGQGAQARGNDVVAIGALAGQSAQGSANAFIGNSAGADSTGSDNSYMGVNAGQGATGASNVAIGDGAGGQTNGGGNVALGGRAGEARRGQLNIASGFLSGAYSQGDFNISSGLYAGTFANGNDNIASGRFTGFGSVGANNVATGTAAGLGTNGSNNIAMGNSAGTGVTVTMTGMYDGTMTDHDGNPIDLNAGRPSYALNNTVAIGNNAYVKADDTLAFGHNAQALAASSIAQGLNSVAGGDSAIAIGKGAQATGTQSISIGTGNVVSGNNSGAIGDPTTITGSGTYSMGNDNGTIDANNSGVFGNNNVLTTGVSLDSVRVIGNANTVNASKTMVMGNNVTVDSGMTGAVVLGDSSSGKTADKYVQTPSATIGGTTYGTFAGSGTLTDGSIVSVGAAGAERQIKNVAAGQVTASSTDAINGSQLYAVAAVASTGWNATTGTVGGSTGIASGSSLTQIKPGDTVTYNAGNNIALTQSGNTIAIATSLTPTFTSVTSDKLTVGPVIIDKTDGINAGGKPITNVAMASTPAGTDATNVDYVKNAASAAKTEVKAGTNVTDVVKTQDGTDGHDIYTVNAKGASTSAGSAAVTVTSSDKGGNVTDYAVDLSDDTKASLGKADTALQTIVTQADGVNAQTLNQANNKANFTAGDNIVLTGSSSGIKIATSLTPTFTSVTSDKLTVGPVIIDKTDGINAGGKPITNVQAGTANTDAVNYGQLQSVSTVANKGWQLTSSASDGTISGSSDHNVAPGGTVTIDAGKNIKLTQVDGKISVATADQVVFTKTTVGNVVTNGSTNKISGLAAGTVSASSTEAINGSQLHGTANSVATILGGNTAVNADGKVTGGFTTSSGTYNTVAEAINAANTAASAAKTTVTAGDNMVVTPATNADGSTTYTVATSKDLKVDSVTAGSTTLNNSGLTIAGGPSVTAGGINAGGSVISNVSTGVAGTDAVNVAQLDKAIAGVTNTAANYQTTLGDTYVNSNGTLTADGKDALKTYDVKGQTATTTNSVISAIKNMNEGGIKFFHTNDGTGNQTSNGTVTNTGDSSASGAYATAIGVGASADALNAIAIGKDAKAVGQNTIAIGTGSRVLANNAGAFGDPNTVAAGADGSYVIGNNNSVASPNTFVMGNDVNVNASGAVVLGNKASVTTAGSVALGENSVAGAAHVGPYTLGGARDAQVAGKKGADTQVVSVGSPGNERQIQNVAPGVVDVNSTDAINGSQLYQVQQQTNNANQNINILANQVVGVEKNANAGTASAMATAGLPQAYTPGKSMIAVSGATYRGQSAMAVGVSTISDNGKWLVKGTLNSNTRGYVGATVGVGYQW